MDAFGFFSFPMLRCGRAFVNKKGPSIKKRCYMYMPHVPFDIGLDRCAVVAVLHMHKLSIAPIVRVAAIPSPNTQIYVFCLHVCSRHIH